MDEDKVRDELMGDADGRDDEPPKGPPSPSDRYPQPVQEVVDPRDPEPLNDRERTAVSGHRLPREDEAG